MSVPDPFTQIEPDNEAILKAGAALIRAHKYSDARNLLNTISSNPTAKTWLVKLDDPQYQLAVPTKIPEQKNTVANSDGPLYKVLMITLVVIFWVVVLMVILPALTNSAYHAGLLPLLCILPPIGVVAYQIVTKRRW